MITAEKQRDEEIRLAKKIIKKAVVRAMSGKFNVNIKSILHETASHRDFEESPISVLESVANKKIETVNEDGFEVVTSMYDSSDVVFLCEVLMSGSCRIVSAAERDYEEDQQKRRVMQYDTREPAEEDKEEYAGTTVDSSDPDTGMFNDPIGDCINALDIISVELGITWVKHADLYDMKTKDKKLPWSFRVVMDGAFKERRYVHDFTGFKTCEELYRKEQEVKLAVFKEEQRAKKVDDYKRVM